MAVTPVVDQRSEKVLARLAERRTQLEALIGAVHDHSISLADVFARAGDPSVTTLEPDALVCRFVYLVACWLTTDVANARGSVTWR
jgi:hypothetical protein